MFRLGRRSKKNLAEAKHDLQRVVNRALEILSIKMKVDISVVDGARTIEEQRENVDNGVSWTMDSRHLVDPTDGLCFAVDIYPWYLGETNHNEFLYAKIAKAMFQAAIELGVDIEWGGFWETPDRPHWQLSRRSYPKPN